MAIIMRNGIAYGGGGGGNETKEISFADYQALVNTPAYDSDIIYFITDANIDDITSPNYNGNLSDFFSISTDYMVGDYCIFNNQLYEFIEDKLAGDWDETKVKITTIKEKINEINSDLGGVRLGTDGEGNVGYFGADGSLIPFKIGNEMSIGLTATAADITEGKTALCNGVIVTGTRPAPSKMQSGTFSMSSASIEHLYKTIYFSPEFDTIPKIDYTLTGGRMSMDNVTVTKTYVTFDIYHNHGNDHHTATVVWTATVS